MKYNVTFHFKDQAEIIFVKGVLSRVFKENLQSCLLDLFLTFIFFLTVDPLRVLCSVLNLLQSFIYCQWTVYICLQWYIKTLACPSFLIFTYAIYYIKVMDNRQLFFTSHYVTQGYKAGYMGGAYFLPDYSQAGDPCNSVDKQTLRCLLKYC